MNKTKKWKYEKKYDYEGITFYVRHQVDENGVKNGKYEYFQEDYYESGKYVDGKRDGLWKRALACG